jgi:dihydrofolate reductase
MRKILVFNWISIDGFIAGSSGETDWFVWDKEIEEQYKQVQGSVDKIFYGRLTYETMANYWPTPTASKENATIRDHMNNTEKVVFSSTLKKAYWNNSKLISQIDPEEIKKMKQLPGKNIVIYGSGSVVSALVKSKLIDEYFLMLNPVVLGKGKPLFQKIDLTLKLVSIKAFKSGVVLCHYQPAQD